ncbi:unnamed protein product [Schistocephalus solidus]|uniref:Uncharacterized protein n=1 Tax=Schistocephalus solidus TaxID=70667 RepID=A0A183SZB4_SCHSO|nr:unnamed protein product [Schistocephalus solidus]
MAAEKCCIGSPLDENVFGLQIQEFSLTIGNGTIICAVSIASNRRFVPLSHYCHVFSFLHNLSQPGSRADHKLVSDRFVRSKMHKDMRASSRGGGLGCECIKVQQHNKPPIGTYPSPDARFSHVHLDIAGNLPPFKGCSYLLTCVNRFT